MITNVLVLCAESPDERGLGGVEVVTAELLSHVSGDIRPVAVYLRHDSVWVEAFRPERRVLSILKVHLDGDPLGEQADFRSAIQAAIVGTDAHVLHVQSLHLAPRAVTAAARDSRIPLLLTLHDHALICENYLLLEKGERYCGIPEDLSRCDRCLTATHGRPSGRIREWRTAVGELVGAADAIVAPSRSVLEHAARIHPTIEARTTLIGWGLPLPAGTCKPGRAPSSPLRVAILGMLVPAKGALRLPALLAACDGLDVEFHLFGATEGASVAHIRRATSRVVFHGAYPRAGLWERLQSARCDVAMLPSIFPESFSLTLSEVLSIGLPVIASDIGALSERVRGLEAGWVFDPWNPDGFAALVSELTAKRHLVTEASARVRRLPHRGAVDMALDHARLWRELASARPRGHVSSETHRAALRRYEQGAALASRRGNDTLSRLLSRVRRSDWYRDLRLRRALSESTRRRVSGLFERIVRRSNTR